MKIKLAVLLSLLAFTALAMDPDCKWTVETHGVNSPVATDTVGGYVVLTNDVRFDIWQSNHVNAFMFNCITETNTRNLPSVILTAWHWRNGGQYAGYFRAYEEIHRLRVASTGSTFTLHTFCSGDPPNASMIVYEDIAWCGPVSATNPPPRFAPGQPGNPYAPTMPDGSDPDWSLATDDDISTSAFTFGDASSFACGATKIHIQIIQTDDAEADFDCMECYDWEADWLLSSDDGPYDTYLPNDAQTWVRSRFEDDDGNPLSPWSEETCINPLP